MDQSFQASTSTFPHPHSCSLSEPWLPGTLSKGTVEFERATACQCSKQESLYAHTADTVFHEGRTDSCLLPIYSTTTEDPHNMDRAFLQALHGHQPALIEFIV